MTLNFVVANLDFKKMAGQGFQEIHLLPLAEGLPEGWNRPGLLEAYREGVRQAAFYPALHGITHFCRPAVERYLTSTCERGQLLRRLWAAGTPYIHWRMPWVGYEYWDPEKPEQERFLRRELQSGMVGQAVGAFAQLFSTVPRSACAPGYRANGDTHRAWADYGIRVGQNGSGMLRPPHMERYGTLQVYRNVDFEPAIDTACSVETCLQNVEDCLARGIPAIVSVHAINFHSSLKDFRSHTLECLDQLLSALEAKHSDLLYLHDEDLYHVVNNGSYENASGTVHVTATKKSFPRSRLATRQKSQ